MIRKLVAGKQTVLVENLQQLELFASFLSQVLLPGDFIALTGPLGSGKTAFTKLICKALGVTVTVSSPTFTILNEYQGAGGNILHCDLYRLSEKEIEHSMNELESYFEDSKSMVFSEWADKAPQLRYMWTWHIDLAFKNQSNSSRIITIESDQIEKFTKLWNKINYEG